MAEPKAYRIKAGIRYEIYAYVGINEITGKQEKRHRAGFPTKTAAREWAAKQVEKAKRGDLTDNSAITFGELARRYMEAYKKRVRPTSYRSAMSALDLHILPILGKQQARRITAHVLQVVLNRWSDDYGKSLWKRCYYLTTSILTNAYKQGIISLDPSDGVILPVEQAKAGETKVKFWTPEEYTYFINHPKLRKEVKWLTVFTLLAQTGMRSGELVALTWADIDFMAGSVRVNKTASHGEHTQYIIQAPKTAAGRRTVPIKGDAIKLLSQWRAVQTREFSEQGVIVNQSEQLVFPNRHNKMTFPTTITQAFKRLERECGVKTMISAHGLRHTYASALGAKNEDPKVRMMLMGQSDIGTTIGTYTHTTEAQLKSAAGDVLDYYNQAAKS